MRFVKMHGLGNDYVYVDCFSQSAPGDPSALAVRVAKRHTGIGSDGLILILPCEGADAQMRIFNADGSEGEMCGNGIRCVAKYLYDRGIVPHEDMRILAGNGIREIRVLPDEDLVRVNMGRPVFDADRIPVSSSTPQALTVRGHAGFCVSTGNPHFVMLNGIAPDAEFYREGPLLENDPVFPLRANIEWNEVLAPHELRMRVWERGSGETMACGTGACASAVAAICTGVCQSPVTVHLGTGTLRIEWDGEGCVYMTGPAVEVFTGEILA